MVDFLKANPAFSMHDVMWNLSVPFVRVMMADATQVIYLTDEQKKKLKNRKNVSDNKVTDDPDEFARALGIPTF